MVTSAVDQPRDGPARMMALPDRFCTRHQGIADTNV